MNKLKLSHDKQSGQWYTADRRFSTHRVQNVSIRSEWYWVASEHRNGHTVHNSDLGGYFVSYRDAKDAIERCIAKST
jgi:hypothetical protein